MQGYRGSRHARCLSSDGSGLLDVLEALSATGRPDQGQSRAVRYLDVCAGAGELTGSLVLRTGALTKNKQLNKVVFSGLHSVVSVCKCIQLRTDLV